MVPMALLHAPAGTQVWMTLRGRDVPMTTDNRIVGIMDSCRAQAFTYEAAVAHTASALEVSAGDVRFVWMGWNDGKDGF